MKKYLLFVLMVILITISSTAFANEEVIEVRLNDKYIDFTDELGRRVDPELINDRTMVPMRKIFETLGASIEWDGTMQKVTARTEKKEIALQIDKTEATLKDLKTEEQKTIILDSAPVILNDRTMVPVRFIAESLEKQVGWDAENRVVVIIDYDEIIKDLEENCSTFVEMLNEQKEELKTFDQTTNLKGTLNYKDTENSKNSEKLTVDGTINIKKSEDKMQLIMNVKITGKGKLYDALKEQGANKFSIDLISDTENDEVYLKSSLNKSDKWVKTEIHLQDTISTSLKSTNIREIVKLQESSLTKDSYDMLQQSVQIIKQIFGNENVKVSGKSTKTYTVKIGLEDVLKALNIYNSEQLDELLSLGNATIETSDIYKNGMKTKGTIVLKIDWKMEESKEKFTVDITANNKFNSYNKDVKITLPKDSEIE